MCGTHWFDHERIRFALPNAVARDVILNVGLIVIGVSAVVEIAAARRFEIVDPRQVIVVDEIGIQTKSTE